MTEAVMVQVVVRLPAEWTREADDLVRRMSRPGIELTRSDVLRSAIRRGLDDLQKDPR